MFICLPLSKTCSWTRADSQALPLFFKARERSLTSVSKHSKQRPSWLPVSSKCSLSKKLSGQWLKWHHASSWNPTSNKNQVIQFTNGECFLLLPASVVAGFQRDQGRELMFWECLLKYLYLIPDNMQNFPLQIAWCLGCSSLIFSEFSDWVFKQTQQWAGGSY